MKERLEEPEVPPTLRRPLRIRSSNDLAKGVLNFGHLHSLKQPPGKYDQD